MQIKRFEADDMTEALRLVKREFGDDAVILSAKEMRPGGFFSAWRKKCVEITAAADYPQDGADEKSRYSEPQAQPLDTESENDRVSLSTPMKSFNPFIPPRQPLSHQPPAANNPGTAADDRLRLSTRAISAPESHTCASAGEMVNEGRAALNGRRRRHETDNRVAEPFYRNLGGRKTIALVGPAGTGKSTAVAKLALHCHMAEKKRTGLISLDRFRIGANSLLEKAACIMNLPFAVARDADQLRTALKDLADVDIVLIDTPGMKGNDPSAMNMIGELLRLAKADETHLVVNATVRQTVLDAAVNAFSPIGIDRLLFTHLDEYGTHPAILHLIENNQLPSAFFSDGVDLSTPLQETTVDRLTRFTPPEDSSGDQVMRFPANGGQANAASLAAGDGDALIQFVANRNSELFHHPDCKSVKRINVENITAFNSIEQAMEQGFKPCRACCNIDVIRNAVTPGGVGHQRMSAI